VGRKALVAASIGLGVIAFGFVTYLFFVRSNHLNPDPTSSPSPPSIPSQVIREPKQPPPKSAQSPERSGPKPEAGAETAQYPTHLRANQEARLRQANYTYTILSADWTATPPRPCSFGSSSALQMMVSLVPISGMPVFGC
jgi:hypothetical protein